MASGQLEHCRVLETENGFQVTWVISYKYSRLIRYIFVSDIQCKNLPYEKAFASEWLVWLIKTDNFHVTSVMINI